MAYTERRAPYKVVPGNVVVVVPEPAGIKTPMSHRMPDGSFVRSIDQSTFERAVKNAAISSKSTASNEGEPG
ncbi:MAG: hypothetical protein GVY13_19105 [Alphaproteobacteria bacterium]|jgi:hypothetical protein|nr:hypothetical protein [Alphaproteobacteria bacterium]